MLNFKKEILAARQRGQQSLDELVAEMTPGGILINYNTLVASGVAIDTDYIAESLSMEGSLESYLGWYLNHGKLTSRVIQLVDPDWVYDNCRHLLDQSELDVADVANALKPWQISDLASMLHDAGLELCSLQTIEISMIPSLVEAGYQVGDIIRHKAVLDINDIGTSKDVAVSDIILLAEQGCLGGKMEWSSLRQSLSATDMRRLHQSGISWDLILDSQSIINVLKTFGMDDDPEVQASLARRINECQPHVVDKLSQLAETLALQCSGLVATALARKINVRALADNLDAFLASGADVAAIANKLSLKHPGEALQNYNKLTDSGAQINVVDCLHRWLTQPFSTTSVYGCSSADEFCTVCLSIEQEVDHMISLAKFPDHGLDETSVLSGASISTLDFLLDRQMPLTVACQLVNPWIIISNHQRLQADYGLTNSTLSKLVDNWLYSLVTTRRFHMVTADELDILLSLDDAIDFSDRASKISRRFDINYVISNYAKFVTRGIRIDFGRIGERGQELDMQLLDEQIDILSSNGVTAKDILSLTGNWSGVTVHIIDSLIAMAGHDEEALNRLLYKLRYELDDVTQLRLLHAGADPRQVITTLQSPELARGDLLAAGLDPTVIVRYANKRSRR